MENKGKSERFQEAMLALQDGEYEIACDEFEELAKDYCDDPGIWWQLLSALRRNRRFQDADKYNEKCLELFPGDVGFILEWSRSYDAQANWDIAIARRKQALQLYSPSKNQQFLPLITEQFLPFIELGQFTNLKLLLQDNWDLLKDKKEALPAILYALDALGDYKKIVIYLEYIIDKKIADLSLLIDGINIGNLKIMAQTAIWNNSWLKEKSKNRKLIRVLSLGQSCLPFTIINRWGLNIHVGNHNKITPFDLGAFSRNTASNAVVTNLQSYLDPNNYFESRNPFGAPQMHHRPSGVHFGHERGRSIIGEDQSKFHILMESKINNFKEAITKEQCLFVFGIVGVCNLEDFVKEIYPAIVKTGHRLLIINMTREEMDCPSFSFLHYVHIPMPYDYSWNDIHDYSSDKGIIFETKISIEIKKQIEYLSV